MTWIDVKYSGQEYLANYTGTNEKTLVGLGFHGYATEAQAKANPNSANAAQMLIASPILAGNVPVGVTNIPNPTTTIQGGVAAADALGGFNIGSWFIRIGEILLGLVLIGVGVARITGAENAISKVVKSGKIMPIPV